MAYTSNKKINGLDSAVTPLGAGNEIVLSQAGTTVKASLSSVEAKIFDAKTPTSTPVGSEVVIVRQTDNNLRQVALSDIVPALNITNAKVSAGAAIVDTKLATIATAGKVANTATTATSANTINAIVTRDGSGNFSAGTITASITGNVTGNASTATTLATGRTIALTGDVTGTTGSFNGSANVSAATTIANNAVTNAKLASGIDASKLTTGTLPIARIADSDVTNAKLASGIDASKLTTGTLPIARIADADVTNAKLATGIDASKLTTGTLPIARIADGAVTLAKLVAAVQEALVPVGAVQAFAMNSAPAGWAACQGQSVSRTSSTYAALFAVIGTTYGAGNGSTTFNLPNIQGIFVRGSGSQSLDGVGYSSTGFGQREQDALQGHFHYINTTIAPGGGDTDSLDRAGISSSLVSSAMFRRGTTDSVTSSLRSDGVNGIPREAPETRPANIAMLYCIKL
jgi:microcystin-dependent protein